MGRVRDLVRVRVRVRVRVSKRRLAFLQVWELRIKAPYHYP